MEIGDWWLGTGGWELVVGGSGGQSLVGWWLGGVGGTWWLAVQSVDWLAVQ